MSIVVIRKNLRRDAVPEALRPGELPYWGEEHRVGDIVRFLGGASDTDAPREPLIPGRARGSVPPDVRYDDLVVGELYVVTWSPFPDGWVKVQNRDGSLEPSWRNPAMFALLFRMDEIKITHV
jgi:hypothetical protein